MCPDAVFLFLVSPLVFSFFFPLFAQGVLQYPMTLSEPPLVLNLLALIVQKCKNTDVTIAYRRPLPSNFEFVTALERRYSHPNIR
jgi:hypothetical protein